MVNHESPRNVVRHKRGRPLERRDAVSGCGMGNMASIADHVFEGLPSRDDERAGLANSQTIGTIISSLLVVCSAALPRSADVGSRAWRPRDDRPSPRHRRFRPAAGDRRSRVVVLAFPPHPVSRWFQKPAECAVGVQLHHIRASGATDHGKTWQGRTSGRELARRYAMGSDVNRRSLTKDCSRGQ